VFGIEVGAGVVEMLEVELQVERRSHRIEDAQAFGNDFGADTVAGMTAMRCVSVMSEFLSVEPRRYSAAVGGVSLVVPLEIVAARWMRVR